MKTRQIRAVLLVLLAGQLAAVGVFWAWQFRLPHRVETGESSVLAAVLFSKSGLPLYTYPTGLPLVQNPYGPVFEWICAQLPAADEQPYLIGRTISALALLGVGIVLERWLRRQRAGWIPILIAASLLLTTKPWILFGPLYRVDALAVFLSVAGFSLVVLGGPAAAVAALAIFTLAVNVKLTALAAPLAAAVHPWTVDRKRALWFLGGMFVLFLGSVAALPPPAP